MPKGFDDLIEFLLDEIALHGEQGISTKDFQSLVKKFYDAPEPKVSTSASRTSDNVGTAVTDRLLLEKVWQWLTAHPEIWVGKNRQGNSLSLSEVEAFERQQKQQQQQQAQSQTKDAASSATQNDSEDAEQSAVDGDGLRIFTTVERIWQAVAGHGVDLKRIPPLEFQALCMIAAYGEVGILQPDLVRLSGQDKRSLPKRTNSLAQNGYIDKTVILIKGHKTSQLRHKRFRKQEQNASNGWIVAAGTTEILLDGRIVADNLVEFLSDHLKDSNIVTMDDLKITLGISEGQVFERRSLWRALERLEMVGLIQRFRAPTEIINSKGDTTYLDCIKLMRQPTEEDRKAYHAVTHKDRDEHRRRLETQKATTAATSSRPQDESLSSQPEPNDIEIDPELEPAFDIPVGTDNNQPTSETLSLEWDPDTVYINLIHDIIDSVGPQGISMLELRNRTFGPFYSRPLESVMGRLTDIWEHSQPPNLEHLSIIRDTVIMGRASIYVYRTFPNFHRAVQSGEAAWEAVRPHHKSVKPQKRELDEWGFPIIPTNHFLRKDGKATLVECVAAANVPILRPTQTDPMIVQNSDGSFRISWGDSGNPVPFSGTPRSKKNAGIPRKPRPDNGDEENDPSEEDPGEQYIRGIPAKEYHARYRHERQAKQDAEERLKHIRRQAEWKAMQEAIEQFNSRAKGGEIASVLESRRLPSERSESSASEPGETIKKAGTQKRSHVNAQQEGLETRKRRRLNPPSVSEPGSAPPDDEPVQNYRPTVAWKRPISTSEQRVQELVQHLSDTNIQGVHINPPGSKEYGPGGTRIRGRKTPLVVVFKFLWLEKLPWFASESSLGQPELSREFRRRSQRNEPVANETRKEALALPDDSTIGNITEDLEGDYGSSLILNDEVERDDSVNFSMAQDTIVVTPGRRPRTPRKKQTHTSRSAQDDITPGVYRVKKKGRPRLDGKKSLIVSFVLPRSASTTSFQEDQVNVGAIEAAEELDSGDPTHNEMENSTLTPVELRPSFATDQSALTPGRSSVSRRTLRSGKRQGESVPSPRPRKRMQEIIEVFQDPVPDSGQDQDHLLSQGADQDAMIPEQSNLTTVFTPSNEVKKSRATRTLRRKRGVPLTGGSARFQRTAIIMDIIDKCGGVIGGDGELTVPFQSTQRKSGVEVVSDRDTITNATKNVVDQGKLKRVAFVFDDQHGRPITKHILLRPDIDFNSAVAQNMIDQLKSYYPRRYVPPVVDDRERIPARPPISRFLEKDEDVQIVAYQTPLWLKEHYERQQMMADARKNRLSKSKENERHKTAPGITTKSLPKRLIPSRTILESLKTVADKISPQVLRVLQQKSRSAALSFVLPPTPHFEEEELSIPRMMVFDSNLRQIPSALPGTLVMLDVVEGGQQVAASESLLSPAENQADNSPQNPLRFDYVINNQSEHHLQMTFANLDTVQLPRTWRRTYNVRTESRSNFINSQLQDFDPNHEQQSASQLDPGLRGDQNVGQSPRISPGSHIFLPNLSSEDPNIASVLDELDMPSSYRSGRQLRNRGGIETPLEGMTAVLDSNQDIQEELQQWNHQGYDMQLGSRQPNTLSESQFRFVNYSLAGQHISALPSQQNRPSRMSSRQVGPIDVDPTYMRFRMDQRSDIPRKTSSAKTSILVGGTKPRRVTDRAVRVTKANPECIISPEVAKRLLYAIIAIRTLNVSSDQTISWTIIDQLFESHPNYTQLNFKNRWNYMRSNHEATIEDLQLRFENAFLVAYEQGELPPFELGGLDTHDWNIVIDWAQSRVKVPSEESRLPPQRRELDRLYKLEIEPRDETALKDEFFKASTTMIRRNIIVHDLDYSISLDTSPAKSRREQDLMLAKSWTRATASTPEHSFDGKAAEVKLRAVPNGLLLEAIKSLLDDRIITAPKAKARRGRSYLLSDSYDSFFSSRPLKPVDFGKATAFKRKLDKIFSSDRQVATMTLDVGNGDIMAITELVSAGQITVRSKLPEVNSTIGAPWPRLSVWGFAEGHYQAKKVAKDMYRWDVEILPTDSYTQGLPLAARMEKTPLPKEIDGDARGRKRIPFWVDIHGNIILKNWSRLLSAVLQALSFRAGSTVKDLTVMMRHLFWDWEIEMMIQWLQVVGVIKRKQNQGSDSTKEELLVATDWWWSVLGDVEQNNTIL